MLVKFIGYVRPVLVKFIGYHSRQSLYKARKDLRQHTSLKKIYIKADLTKATSELAFKARQLKRRGVIAEIFTSDCKVFAKNFPGSHLVLIRNEDELKELSSRVPYNNATNRVCACANLIKTPFTKLLQFMEFMRTDMPSGFEFGT